MIDATTVVGVVVTYFPSADLASNVESALRHAGAVVIVDNTPGERTPDPVAAAARVAGVSVVRLGANRGVGAALNVGVQEARRRGAVWVLTLDQDTALRPEWTEVVREGRRVGGDRTVGVGVGFQHPGLPDPQAGHSRGVVNANRIITSGSLWSLDLLGRIGPFREDFMVDGIDNELCFRARKMGYTVVLCEQIAMRHEMGILLPATWLGRPFFCSTYNATRYYYIFRNFVELVRLYGLYERSWAKQEARWLVYLIKSSLAARDPGKLTAAGRGVWDGLMRRFGTAPASIASESGL